MFEALRQRTLIIGNSGAGKSTLAQKLALATHAPIIDLDLLHWEGDGYGRKRDEGLARQLVRDEAAKPRWIIEGVFGWLAEVALSRATAMLWLDVPWTICREGLLERGLRRGATDKDHVDLLAWAEAYWTRETPSSFAGHARLFASFPGPKRRLHDRREVDLLLSETDTI